MRARKITALIVSAIVTVGIGAVTTTAAASRFEQAQQTAAAQVTAADVQALRIGAVRTERSDIREFIRVKAERELAAAKKTFDTKVTAASKVFKKAKGKVSVSTQRKKVTAAEHAEKTATTADDVTVQTRKVTQATHAAAKKLQAYKAEQKRKAEQKAARRAAQQQSGGYSRSAPPSSGGSGSSGDGWFNEMRSILNSVGGGWVTLKSYGAACGAATCSQPGRIYVTPAIASWSHSRKVWAMDHELAHQYQFRVWQTLMASKTYHSLFGGNIELLANCMTQARGLNYSSQRCSSAQVAFGAGIWAGRVG